MKLTQKEATWSPMANKPKQIISIQEVRERRAILVHGDSGAGKSLLLTSAPRGLVLAVDNTLDTAKLAGRECEVWPVNAWEDCRECYLYLLRGGHNDYEWFGVDNVTVGQRLNMDELLKIEYDRSNGKRDPDIPTRNDYLKNQKNFLRFIQAVNALPMKVMFSAWSMWSGEEAGLGQRIPALHGGKGEFSNAICAEMRAVGYMAANEETGKRGIAWKPTARWYARDGFNAFGEGVAEPTIPKLEAMIAKKGQ
jgi:hypothetical protein